jgi:hypothetical protein
VSGFAPADWHEFFEAAAAASAALLGLLFVAISINLKQILEHRHLPGWAAGTLGALLSGLVVCNFGRAAGQSNRALGVEILATCAVVATQAIFGGEAESERFTQLDAREHSDSPIPHLPSWEETAACLRAQGVGCTGSLPAPC